MVCSMCKEAANRYQVFNALEVGGDNSPEAIIV
jgi:hypothetical protein